MKNPNRFTIIRRVAIRFVILEITALGVTSCNNAISASGSITNPTDATTVAVAKVTRENLSKSVDITAEFLPWQEVEIHSKVSGFVNQMNVDVGDHAKAGDILATLEIPELNDDLKQAQAAILTAQENVKSMQADYEDTTLIAQRMAAAEKDTQGLLAQQDIDSADAKNRADEANLASAKQKVAEAEASAAHLRDMIAYSKIIAPFDGVVTRRYADVGALVQAGTVQSGTSGGSSSMPLISFQQVNRLRLEFPVPESEAASVQVGEPVQIDATSIDKSFQGTVARFADKIDTSTRTMLTEVDVENSDGTYIPGMYATVHLTLSTQKEALTIPIQSLAPGDPPSVLVVENHRIEKRNVTVGIKTPDSVQILDGLKEGDLIVVGNGSALQPGQQVSPKLVDNQTP